MQELVKTIVSATLTWILGCGALIGPYLAGCTASGVQYQIAVSREFSAQSRPETAPFRTGEKFRLKVTPQQDSYAYLLHAGSSGKYTVLFPMPQVNDGSNLLHANESVEIPPEGSFQFDGRTGEERLVLCLSGRPNRELESLVQSSAPDAEAAESLLVELERANRQDSSLVKTLTSDATKVCLVARDPKAVLVSRMTLRHEPAQADSAAAPATSPTVAPGSPNSPDMTRPGVSAPFAANIPHRNDGLTDNEATGQARVNQAADAPAENVPTVLTIDEALRRGWLTVSAHGAGLSSVRLCVTPKRPLGLRIVVPVGSYFRSGGKAQDMVSTEAATLDFADQREVNIAVPAVCANFDRPEPDSGTRFSLHSLDDARLRRLLQVIAERKPRQVAAQVAVWAVANDVTRANLDATFRQFGSAGGRWMGGVPAAQEADIATARELVKAAGLDAGQFRLFR